jgi:hypothetical protein
MPGASITCPVTASRADCGVAALTVLSANIAGQGPLTDVPIPGSFSFLHRNVGYADGPAPFPWHADGGKAPVWCGTQIAIPLEGVAPARGMAPGASRSAYERSFAGRSAGSRTRWASGASRSGAPAMAPAASRGGPEHALSSAHACRPAAPYLATPTQAPSAWPPLVSEGPFHSPGRHGRARFTMTRTRPDLKG